MKKVFLTRFVAVALCASTHLAAAPAKDFDVSLINKQEITGEQITQDTILPLKAQRAMAGNISIKRKAVQFPVYLVSVAHWMTPLRKFKSQVNGYDKLGAGAAEQSYSYDDVSTLASNDGDYYYEILCLAPAGVELAKVKSMGSSSIVATDKLIQVSCKDVITVTTDFDNDVKRWRSGITDYEPLNMTKKAEEFSIEKIDVPATGAPTRVNVNVDL